MPSFRVAEGLAATLYARANASRWEVPLDAWAAALEQSVARSVPDDAAESEVARYLTSLHLEDLALACACAGGHDAAWEHFVREHRPGLYRSADAIDPTGGARDLADALYADLYGLIERRGQRASLFRYFHGRSSLATWLRAILAQRHVDRHRATRRLEPLPDDETVAAPPALQNLDHSRFLELLQAALAAALGALEARDRLRIACYYAQGLTLAQIGRLFKEHEATVSRHLSRIRRLLRATIEGQLRTQGGLGDAEISECFAAALDDHGALDLAAMLEVQDTERKESDSQRSR